MPAYDATEQAWHGAAQDKHRERVGNTAWHHSGQVKVRLFDRKSHLVVRLYVHLSQ